MLDGRARGQRRSCRCCQVPTLSPSSRRHRLCAGRKVTPRTGAVAERPACSSLLLLTSPPLLSGRHDGPAAGPGRSPPRWALCLSLSAFPAFRTPCPDASQLAPSLARPGRRPHCRERPLFPHVVRQPSPRAARPALVSGATCLVPPRGLGSRLPLPASADPAAWRTRSLSGLEPAPSLRLFWLFPRLPGVMLSLCGVGTLPAPVLPDGASDRVLTFLSLPKFLLYCFLTTPVTRPGNRVCIVGDKPPSHPARTCKLQGAGAPWTLPTAPSWGGDISQDVLTRWSTWGSQGPAVAAFALGPPPPLGSTVLLSRPCIPGRFRPSPVGSSAQYLAVSKAGTEPRRV